MSIWGYHRVRSYEESRFPEIFRNAAFLNMDLKSTYGSELDGRCEIACRVRESRNPTNSQYFGYHQSKGSKELFRR